MEKTNNEILNIVETASKRFITPDNNNSILQSLIRVIRNQQQEIELLQQQIRYHVEQVDKDQL